MQGNRVRVHCSQRLLRVTTQLFDTCIYVIFFKKGCSESRESFTCFKLMDYDYKRRKLNHSQKHDTIKINSYALPY